MACSQRECPESELELGLVSRVSLVQEGERGVVWRKYGIKVETGRALESAAERGVLTRVVRSWIVRGCRDLVLCFNVE